MESKLLTTEARGAALVVTLNRPKNRNALNPELMREMADLAIDLRRGSDVAAIVVTGEGGAFSAGADIKDPRLFSPDTSIESRRLATIGPEMVRAWETLPQVTIAAIEGYAIGGGLALAMACDFRVAGRGSFVSVPEVDLGAIYGMHSIPRLVATIGPARTKRLVMMAERIPAETCADWALFDELTDDGKALDHALEMADTLAAKPRLAMEMNKRAINAVAMAFSEIASHADMDQLLAASGSRKSD